MKKAKAKKKVKKKSARKRTVQKKLFAEMPAKKMILSTDKAHSPGHRKLGDKNKKPMKENGWKKNQLQESAINTAANSDIIRKHNSRHRRIISGAAIGKTGRIVIKE